MRKIVRVIILFVPIVHSLLAYGLFCSLIVSLFLDPHGFLCCVLCGLGSGLYSFLCLKYILSLEFALLKSLPHGHDSAKPTRSFLCLALEFLFFIFHCLIIASVIMRFGSICFGLSLGICLHAMAHCGITALAIIHTYKNRRLMPRGIVSRCNHAC